MESLIPVLERIIANLWQDYKNRVPSVAVVENALRARGETWQEDHIAFRTLPGVHCGAHVLQAIFEALGYRKKDSFFFEDKQLNAFWMEPPLPTSRKCSEALPKVFISELIPDSFSAEFREVLSLYAKDVNQDPIDRIRFLAEKAHYGDASAPELLVDEVSAFLSEGPAWRRPLKTHWETLKKESEYAAWTLIFGNCPNHFTVSAYLMGGFRSLSELNNFILDELGLRMNQTGGRITKGAPELYLEQSATLADDSTVVFQDSVMRLPHAFIEFIWRYTLPEKKRDGLWDSYFQAFIPDNADKIFESTWVANKA